MTMIDDSYQRFCKERFPLPTEEDVATLEKRIGVSFPPDYQQYILRFNGGYFTEPDIEPSNDEFPLIGLTEMYGIDATNHSAELGRSEDLAIFDDNDPPILFPIGYTTLGFFILLITEPADDFGCIYLRTFDSPVLKTKNESHYLAEGIDEFFGLLGAGKGDG